MKKLDSNVVLMRTCKIIRDERRIHDMTQTDFCKRFGIGQAYLSKIENDAHTPSLLIWLRFCRAFSVNPELPANDTQYSTWASRTNKRLKAAERAQK